MTNLFTEVLAMETTKLWNRNFSLVILASSMGTIGGIAGSFALAFLVFDETGSTLASALILAIQLLPFLFIPIVIAPIMDRLPRKTFLVMGVIELRRTLHHYLSEKCFA